MKQCDLIIHVYMMTYAALIESKQCAFDMTVDMTVSAQLIIYTLSVVCVFTIGIDISYVSYAYLTL